MSRTTSKSGVRSAAVQAVILAAGESTRTHPLTITKPKPLLKIAGLTILEHNLNALDGLVSEVIIVIGFKGEMIQKHIGEKFGSANKRFTISYAQQKTREGTGHALKAAEHFINDKFIVLMGDNIYDKEDIKSCLKHRNSILGIEVDDPEKFGVLEVKENVLLGIDEKPAKPKSFLINTGLYVLTKDVFNIDLTKTKRKEYELTDYLNALAKKGSVNVEKVSGYWLPVGYPWDILDVNEALLEQMKKGMITGVVEPRATIKGVVSVGKGTIIKNGAYIEGPVVIGDNCIIGPNCYIRGFTSIGNDCKIGNGVEVKNSVFGDHVSVGHLSYVGDSVVGDAVNFGAGTITANLRHDNTTVRSVVKDELIDSGRRKFGAVIGDGVHTGIHTSIYPGRKIWPGKGTHPGEIVKKDVV